MVDAAPIYTFFIHVDCDSLDLQNYFTKILEDYLKAVIKPQYVDQKDEVCKVLDLLKVKDRDVKDLSGGELQRIACAMVCIAGRGHIYVRRALVLPRRCDRHLRAHPRARQVRDCHVAQSLRARLSLRCPYSVVTMPFSLRDGWIRSH